MSFSHYDDSSLQIYEFSRELLEISKKDGRWVSGGFGAEVGKSNKDVPQKIRDAVNRGDFRINDNYPPKQEGYALIAREIDEYSVLAVATRAGDDKIRNLIAYRYFWLQKPTHKDIDGVGTLLIWWMNDVTGEPKFDFEWTLNSNSFNFYTAKQYSKEDSYQYFEQYRSHVQDILPKIKQYPFAYQFNEVESRNALHYLALYLNKEYRTPPISWAWKVGWLEHPEKFTLICSDEKSHQYNSRDIKNYQQPLIESVVPAYLRSSSPVSTPSQTSSLQGTTRGEQSAAFNGQQQSTVDNSSQRYDTINNSDLHQIRTCLNNIADWKDNQNVKREMQRLGDILERNQNINFENHNIIDNKRKGYSSISEIKYTALLAILGYISVSEWLGKLKERNYPKYEKAFLSLHKQMLDISEKRKNNFIYEMLKNKFREDIIALLLAFKPTNHRDTNKNIEWLLVKSDSIWVTCFNEYAKELVVKLMQGHEQKNDQFHNALPQNTVQTNKNLALLFEQLPNYILSAYFYQLSERSVPSDIYDKAEILIIPTIRKETNQDQTESLIFQKIKRNRISIFTLVIGIFIGVFFAKNFFNPPSVIVVPPSVKNLQNSMTLYIEKNDYNLKREIQTYLDKLKSPNKEMRNQPDYKYIKNEFIPKIKIELENVEKVNNFPDEVKKIQNILKVLGYQIGNVDGNLGNTSMKEYQNFQKKNKDAEQIRQEDLNGRTRKSTLEALINQLTDKQVGETAKFLLTKLNREDSKTFEESLKNLQDCSRQESSFTHIDTYINKCLK